MILGSPSRKAHCLAMALVAGVLALFPGRLYSQSVTGTPVADPEFLNCRICSTDVRTSCPSLNVRRQVRPTFIALPGNSLLSEHRQNDPTDSSLHMSAPFFAAYVSTARHLWFLAPQPFGRPPFWPETQQSPSESQKKKRREKTHNPSASPGSPHHIFYVVPAFNVSYQRRFTPLTARGKWDEWLQSTYDPRGFGLYAFESATLEYSSSDGFCGYGKGWGGYGECYGSVEADANISSFLGDYLFPVVMHQDPRYFRLGEGGFGKRVWHAISHVFVTYNDSGHTVFYTSALSGTFIAAGISNLYYPSQDVGFGQTMSRAALDLGNTALFNLAAEFWPDIHRKLHF